MRPRILPQPLQLGTARDEYGRPVPAIRDAEKFCAAILDDALEHWGMYITDEEYRDSITELLEQAVKLERKYQPERSPSFAGYAHFILRRRAVDAAPRRFLGRSGLKIAERSHEELDERTTETARPGTAVATLQSDPDSYSGTHVGGVPGDRARREAWSDTILGL